MHGAGDVGDGDPVQAVEDAIVSFTPDEIVVSTHPEGRSNWLEHGVVEAIGRASTCRSGTSSSTSSADG